MPSSPEDERGDRAPSLDITRRAGEPSDPFISADTLIYDPGDDSPVESPAARARRTVSSIPSAAPAPKVDIERLAHFRVVEKIGEGGMGSVYRAVDEYLQRVVALKVLTAAAEDADDVENTQRLLREARAASRISHPNVVTVYAAGEYDGHAFIAMEHVEGVELGNLIGPTGLDVERALDITRQVALGLGAAHEQGLVHRDVKPANVLVCPGDRVKILDFGLAKPGARTSARRSEGTPAHLDEGLDVFNTQGGVIWGSLYYMSPEQACGDPLDPRTDVFSLGVVLYQMLVGELPFVARGPNAQLHAMMHDEPRPLHSFSMRIPGAVERIVAKALAKDRDLRYGDGKEMAADLATALQRLREFGAVEFESVGELPSGAHVSTQREESAAVPAARTAVEYDRSYPKQLLAFQPDGSQYALTISTALALDLCPRGNDPRGGPGTAVSIRGDVYELVAVEAAGPGTKRYCFSKWPESAVIRQVVRYTPEYAASLVPSDKAASGIGGVFSSLFGRKSKER